MPSSSPHLRSVILLATLSLLSLKLLDAQSAPVRYQPTQASLAQHAVPQWYKDAKLGIFVH